METGSIPAGNQATRTDLPAPALAKTDAAKGSVSSVQIASLLAQIESATRIAEKLIDGRPIEDLTWKPQATAWSIAECLDHLALTTNVFLTPISQAIAKAPALTSDRSLRTGTLARLFIRNLEPPYRIRFKVLPQLTPCHREFQSVWAGFLTSQSDLQAAIRSATGLAIDRVKIKSPVYARIAYNIYGALRMLAAHERRHLWQIQQILAAIDAMRPRQETV